MTDRSNPSSIYAAAVDLESPPRISARRILQLVLKTWPFVRPLLKHVIALASLTVVISVLFAVIFLIGDDLLNNKILVGDPVQPLQAELLLLDESYVIDAVPTDSEAQLTNAQRKIVRDRVMIASGLLILVALPLAILVPYYFSWVAQSINQNLRVAMIERAEHLSLEYHNEARVGDAIFRVYQDSAMINSLLLEGIAGPVAQLYYLTFGLIFIAFFDPRVALACVLAGLPMLWLTVRFTPRLRHHALLNRRAYSSLTSRLQEALSAVKVVKANQAEGSVFAWFNRDSRRSLDAAFTIRRDIVLLGLLVRSLGAILVIGLEYILVAWVMGEEETFLGVAAITLIGFAVWNLGAFQAARGYVAEFVGGSTEFVAIWSRLQDLFVGLERAFYLLELEPRVQDPDDPKPFPATPRTVRWRDVRFSFGDTQVLRGVNLEARAGTTTAIVGASGAGKSTLMTTLLRIYDPDQGVIEVDGTDLKDFALNELRANVSIALQKNVLFASSVRENIGYATRNASDEAIEAAAQIACAHDFIADLASGYEEELGERGSKLSTGQRQRIAIARAIVRDTPILILDEPTASLDAATEQQVLANIARWGSDKIVFIITHRLSTIRSADQIAFLEGGVIAELGTHEELMSNETGGYRRFVSAEQLAGET